MCPQRCLAAVVAAVVVVAPAVAAVVVVPAAVVVAVARAVALDACAGSDDGQRHRDAAGRAITIIIAAAVVAAVAVPAVVVAVVAAAEVVPLLLDAAGDLDGAVLVACGRAAFRASTRERFPRWTARRSSKTSSYSTLASFSRQLPDVDSNGEWLVYVYIEMKWQNFHFDIAGSDSLVEEMVFSKIWRKREDIFVGRYGAAGQINKHPSHERDSTRNM